jgi:hypothetical protein
MSRVFEMLGVIAAVLAMHGGSRDANAQVTDHQTESTAEVRAAEEPAAEEQQYVPPEEIVREAFDPPPESVPLSKTGRLWIDRKRQRVYLDGYVTLRRGLLEMFACPMGTKEHESVVATLARARELHAALLAIEASPGTPVRHLPEFVPATGQVIRVWVCWRDEKGKFHAVDARQWVQHAGTKRAMTAEWVFAGSNFWQDPSDGREHYQADAGDMICVSNFSTAMMDVTISSSAEADELQFMPYERRIPKLGTPLRLILAPIPNPTDQPASKPSRANELPTEEVLPPKKSKQKKSELDTAESASADEGK